MAKSMIEQEKEMQRIREQKKNQEQRAALMAQMMAGNNAAQSVAQVPQDELQNKRGRKKSRAATIAERRPMQKSIHFTADDTLNMEQIKFNLLKAGVDKADANAENIVYFFFQHCLAKFGTDIPLEEFKKILV